MCKNKIQYLYKPTSPEKILIEASSAKKKGAWEKKLYDSFKNNLKSFLLKEQEGLCCYCKDKLRYETGETHIEHIISKDNNSNFTYSLKNLALACRYCNGTKRHDIVYAGKTNEKALKRYPSDSKFFSIPHPHFDNYYDHISFFLDFYPIEVNNSEKGTELIRMCNLRRYGSCMEKIKAEYQSNSIGIEKDIYELLFNANKDNALEEIEKIVDKTLGI